MTICILLTIYSLGRVRGEPTAAMRAGALPEVDGLARVYGVH